ncbi:methyltransferase [Methanococcoides sp.]|uniref:methyltransferase n=1 Tax=Methanococcoides sp. TaxID=1966350 RepID=UPI00272E28D5|nr:methyltransferase [Methanococcoides sp.]
MKVLDMDPKISSESLDRMIKGCDGSRILFTALDFNLFDLLDGSMTAEEISSKIETDVSMTGKFLNTLVAMQLLVKRDGKYVNTELASTFLRKSSPFYQGHILRLSGNTRDWLRLNSILKGDVPEEDDRSFEDVFDPSFILAMAEGSMRGGLHRTVNEVSKLPEFKKARKLLDLGGGHGLYAIAFAQMNPDLDAVVFDLPHVTEVTKEFIGRYGMNERVGVIGGNFLEGEIKNVSECDIIFASDALYCKPDVLAGVLKKIYGALNDGGSVILKHWILNDDRTAPATSVFFDLMLSLRGDWHHIYTENEYIELLQEAGFSNIRTLDISSQASPSVIVMATKEA